MALVKLMLSPFHLSPHLLHVHGAPQLRLPKHLVCMRVVGDSSLTVAGGDGVGGKKQ